MKSCAMNVWAAMSTRRFVKDRKPKRVEQRVEQQRGKNAKANLQGKGNRVNSV